MPTIKQLVVYDKALATPDDLEEARELGKGKGFRFYEIDFTNPYWVEILLLKIKRITKCSGKKPNLVSACFNYSQELELMKVRMWVRDFYTNFLDLPNVTIMYKPMFEKYYFAGLDEVVVERGMGVLDPMYVTKGASSVAKNRDVNIVSFPKIKTHQLARIAFGNITKYPDFSINVTGITIRDIIIKNGINGVNIRRFADLKYKIEPEKYHSERKLDITNFKIKDPWEQMEGLKIDENRELIVSAMCTMAIKKYFNLFTPR